MPELPEVETIRRQLENKIVGKKLFGKRIKAVSRRAKMLFLDFDDGSALVFHLKLTGQLLFNGQPSKITRAIFGFNDKTNLIFNDVRKFGWHKIVQDPSSMKEVLALGPEPFDLSLKEFFVALQRRGGCRVKPLLLDQKFIAGIGNIYADEILFKAKVHPTRRAGSLHREEVKRLFSSIQNVLLAAIRAGGSSVKDYFDTDGQKGGYSAFHRVYQRQGLPCKKCGALIKRIKMGGRSTHFCPQCQT